MPRKLHIIGLGNMPESIQQLIGMFVSAMGDELVDDNKDHTQIPAIAVELDNCERTVNGWTLKDMQVVQINRETGFVIPASATYRGDIKNATKGISNFLIEENINFRVVFICKHHMDDFIEVAEKQKTERQKPDQPVAPSPSTKH